MESNLLYNKLITNNKEAMTTNDNKSRRSLSRCHVAVDDVAPGWPSFTVMWHSCVIVDMLGCVFAKCSGVVVDVFKCAGVIGGGR